MACSGTWVRKGPQTAGITITPNKAVDLLSVGIRFTNRTTGAQRSLSDSAVRPPTGQPWVPGGSPWNVPVDRICQLVLVVQPTDATVRVQVQIGTKQVHDKNCSGGQWPIAGEFTLTTWGP